ncbi:MAG: radical SAM protein [Bdellovibrio sp.]
MEQLLHWALVMESRAYKDIIAFKWEQGPALAFHARNLEVAEISEQTWSALKKTPENDFSALNELQAWEAEENAEARPAPRESHIRTIVINVTQICNLHCTYCAAGGDGTYGSAQTKINVEKTLPQLKYFIEKLPPGSRFQVNFLGGEPLLYPEGIAEIGNYVKLMTAGKNIHTFFAIVTNGTLITERVLSLFQELKMRVTVSLDGPAVLNDKVRPTKDGSSSTAKTVDGLAKLSAIKDALSGLTVHGVFNKANMNLVEAYYFYRSLNVDSYEFTYGVEERDEDANKAFIDQMNKVAQAAYTYGGEIELRKIGMFNQYFTSLDNQQKTENYCGAGKSLLVVDAKNNLFTCPWDVGNKQEQVGSGTELIAERLSVYSPPLIEKNNCQSCWARYLCGGGCMYIHKQGAHGQNKKDDSFCLRTRSLIRTTLLYYKQSRTSC